MKSKAHSKKCVDLGISVGLLDEQDTEESGKPPSPRASRHCLHHTTDADYTASPALWILSIPLAVFCFLSIFIL